MNLTGPLITTALGVVISGCPKDDSPPIVHPPTEKKRLADRISTPDAPKALKIPGATQLSCGIGVCRVSLVETSHTVSVGKTSLTSEDSFIKVVVAIEAADAGTLDLSGAKLVSGTDEFQIAPDAQKLAGTRQLSRHFTHPERFEAILFFEVPDAVVAAGLKLYVAGGDGVLLQ